MPFRTTTHRSFAAVTAAAAAVLLTACAATPPSDQFALPPAHSGFDYQIGGAYEPPAGVTIISRDRTAAPAPGAYNICYVNAFQAQPDAEGDWDPDLLLRTAGGEIVYDDEWNEAVLDLRTATKRERIAAKVNTWIDGCADKGYQAVEPDNLDTYERFPKYLDAQQAKSFIGLLTEHAHGKGLAVGQKNTVDLAGARDETGLDFAVTEECGTYDECGDYAAAYDDRVLVVEYTAKGLAKACAGWGGRLSIVRRDLDVLPAGSSGYVRQTC
ncbi:endo alpha-1,4 polygalactosaminidase [Streptomyces beijiangensis]|uniref:Endo alpha-1,4 polygalactosaminidase n=1 Tax=Streptomyces beijiangensis TaxID=163361 RepID=A0A939F5G9_9ACTN|nr:endo alpha-1,4 polygalactosaminidase [Streptomyces beijiangensis]MBO0512018.1 endo alpha-1,4 polygalactosaminidase [Streptomyces beijiangensis]